MSDVAARAGVSHQTVSRVLNAHPSVRPATRERVLAAIEELGYRPNRAARALVTARSTTVGILTVGNAHFGPASTVLAVEAAARAEGYFVSVSSLAAYDAAAAAVALDQLVDQGVDGVVVVAPLEDVAHVVDDVAPTLPVVVVAARPGVPTTSPARYVCVDQRRGAQMATEHLLDLAHTAVVHVAGPGGWFDAVERAGGYREAMEARGLEPVVVEAGDWSARRGYEVGERLAAEVREAGGPTAVVAGNDYLATGLLRAFWEHGVRVPRDVSVVGFDDIEGSAYLVPALTTVRQPFAALGQAAMRTLLQERSGQQPGRPGPPSHPHQRPERGHDDGPRVAAVIEPELVVRGSTAVPR
ncbi:LacI family transcriptional regulator [Xylanimonas oleitrophica]|uniref:LacI family transcriptional regulator n=1 Tax=Xylanimonas oleitrophica TaxID=2607479 RepID=A0A2W5WJX8_9MICO|nr:LacI family DNA-binding transcriptional regulator [Xylanimonas oleitrophica]PZR51879.1 LacI family transcriptional regulator [Xylanimonas oleitrophica]